MKSITVLLAFFVLSPLGALCVECNGYVTLDLSNINEEIFQKTDKRSEIEITLSQQLANLGNCIGKVVFNEKVLVEEPEAPYSRNVRILRIHKTDPHYFDVEETPSGTSIASTLGSALYSGSSYVGHAICAGGSAAYNAGCGVLHDGLSVISGLSSNTLRMIGNIMGSNIPQAIEASKGDTSIDEEMSSGDATVASGNADVTSDEDSDSNDTPDTKASVSSESEVDNTKQNEVFDPKDFEEILEVHTNFQFATARLRFKKDENGQYVSLEYTSKDIDVCSDYGSVLVENKYSIHTVYRSKHFELIGNVKCGKNILVDSRNVFGRTLEIDNLTKEIKVNTSPVIGNVLSESFVVDKSKSVYVPKNANGGFKYGILDLAQIYSYPNENEDLQTVCGPECVFYDGCSSLKNRLVSLYYEDKPVFFDPSVHCLSAKCEEVDDITYVTVYAKYKNSEKVKVKTYRSMTGGAFSEVERKPVDLIIPKDIKIDDEGASEDDEQVVSDLYRNLGISDKSKLINRKLDDDEYIKVYGGKAGFVFHIPQNFILDTFIGKVYYGDKSALIANSKDDLYNREVIYYKEDKIFVVLDEFKDGRFERTIYEENDQGVLKPCSQSSLAIDLEGKDLKDHLRLITTDGSRTFLTSMKHVEKIGTVKQGDRLVTPNKHQNYHVGLLYDEKELFSQTILNNGRAIYQNFSSAHPFDDNLPPVHVENAKEFVILNLDDISCIYNHLYNLENLHFTGASLNLGRISGVPERVAHLLDVRNIGDYYSIEVAPSKIFTHCIGYIMFAKDTIIPIDYNLYSRTVYIPSTSLSHFIVKSCDFTECWSDLYVSKIIDGKVKFEIQEKIAVDIDIDDTRAPDARVSKVTSASVRFFRIREDLSYKYKIGKVTLKGVTIAENSPGIFTRMVNFAHANDAENSNKGTVRIMNVERWDKYSKVYSIEPEGKGIKFSENKPKDISLDIQYGAVSRPAYVTLQQRDDVLNFFVDWQNSNDYVLRGIKASFYNNEYNEDDQNSSMYLQKIIKDNLPGDLPVHVRVHLDKKVVIAVENIPKDLPKPSNLDTYPLGYDTDEYEGQIYAYSIKNNETKEYKEYVRDDSFRTLYTPFFYNLKKPTRR